MKIFHETGKCPNLGHTTLLMIFQPRRLNKATLTVQGPIGSFETINGMISTVISIVLFLSYIELDGSKQEKQKNSTFSRT